MSHNRLNEKEPAGLVGAIASVLGFAALIGADVSTLQGLGTALGISGTQGMLTRQSVYSPETVNRLRMSQNPIGSLASLMSTGGAASRREPTLMIGLITMAGGFLVQFFAGVDLTQALTSAGAISGVQGVATRGRVFSPASARSVAAARVLVSEFGPDERRAALLAHRIRPA